MSDTEKDTRVVPILALHPSGQDLGFLMGYREKMYGDPWRMHWFNRFPMLTISAIRDSRTKAELEPDPDVLLRPDFSTNTDFSQVPLIGRESPRHMPAITPIPVAKHSSRDQAALWLSEQAVKALEQYTKYAVDGEEYDGCVKTQLGDRCFSLAPFGLFKNGVSLLVLVTIVNPLHQAMRMVGGYREDAVIKYQQACSSRAVAYVRRFV